MTKNPMRFLVAAAVVLAACEPAGDGDILEIDGESVVQGLVFRDVNASSSFDEVDEPAPGLDVALVLAGTAATVARARTSSQGTFAFPLVPVGRYDVVVPATALADSMSIVFRDPPGSAVDDIGPGDTTSVTVGVDDTAFVRIGIAYSVVTVEQARALPTGRKVFVRGVALSSIGAAGDSLLFIQGETRAIRATRIASGDVAPGDSVLVLGTTAARDGQPVITNGSATTESTGAAFDTLSLDAAAARSAGDGLHDAQLVEVEALTVTDTATSGVRFIITAEDPSGSVEISIPVSGIIPDYAPGAELTVVGLLVPKPGVVAVWQIRPRSSEDLVLR